MERRPLSLRSSMARRVCPWRQSRCASVRLKMGRKGECVCGDSPGGLLCGSKWEGTEECVRGDSPGVLMYRVDQNHICTGFIRYFWPANPEIDVHIRCKYTVLANPAYLRPNMESRKS